MPIRPDLPPSIPVGDPVPRVEESPETLALLARRRSAPALLLGEPGPSPGEVDQLLALAMRAPDHRKLEPWRFLVIEGEARFRLGDLYAALRAAADPGVSDSVLAEARALPTRAPVMVAVVSSPVQDPKATPQWEQELSAGAVCQTLLIAAAASGWDASWITDWPAYSRDVANGLGLAAHERIAGFIFLGTSRERPLERVRPALATKVQRWTGD
jgi:nitroreductase